jgi:hypothetical protein
MPIPVTITLNSIVGTPGPFNLYSNTDNYTTAFETGVSASGNIITSTNVPDGTTIIKIKSTGVICTYEITKSIVGLPTVTPTTIPTSTPTPTNTNTPTPTVTCVNCSTSTVTSGTTNSGFLLQTHCLDLSSASNGATIFIGYQAYSRLNRFYVFENGLTTVSGTNTGWVGTDNTYSNPPYNSPGSPTGTISFTYNSSKTYELKVEIAPENPSNPQNDSYEFTLTCGGVVTFTPTPTSTLTPTATPYRIVANDLWVGDPGDVEFGDDTSCGHTSPINTVYGGVDAWLYSATNICDATSLETDNALGFNWISAEMSPNQYIWISQTGITYDSTLGNYVRLYKRSGSTDTLLPSGTCINCLTINEPTPTPTPIPQITVNIYGRQNTPYDAETNNLQLVYQTYNTTLGTVNHTTSGIQKSLIEGETFLVSPSVDAGGYLNLGAFLRVTDDTCDYLEVNVNVFAAGAYSSGRFTNSAGSLLSDYGCGLQGSLNGVSIPVSQAIDVYITPTSTGVCLGSALIPPGLECLTTNQ